MSVTEIGVKLPNAIGAASRPDEIVVTAKQPAFAELVDVVNPLQHVPLVGDVYRNMTGDKISDGAKLGGHVALGTVVGGPVGALIGAGVFLLEKLFGNGRHSQTEQVGLSVRSEDRAAAEALRHGGTESFAPASPLAAKRPQMSSSEFAALIGSFQTAKAESRDQQSEDIGERMRANLAKLDAIRTDR